MDIITTVLKGISGLILLYFPSSSPSGITVIVNHITLLKWLLFSCMCMWTDSGKLNLAAAAFSELHGCEVWFMQRATGFFSRWAFCSAIITMLKKSPFGSGSPSRFFSRRQVQPLSERYATSESSINELRGFDSKGFSIGHMVLFIFNIKTKYSVWIWELLWLKSDLSVCFWTKHKGALTFKGVWL